MPLRQASAAVFGCSKVVDNHSPMSIHHRGRGLSDLWRCVHLALQCLLIVAMLRVGHASAQDEPPVVSGRLRPHGHHLTLHVGHTTTVLNDGSVLVYGNGPWVHSEDSQAAQHQALQVRHQQGYSTRPDTDPKLWDAASRGWRRLPLAPECPHPVRALHTATLLSDGQVLMAGGLCDQPMLADELRPNAAHTALSLWDPAKRQWQRAPALTEARLFHSASLMPDGAVLIIGGMLDPGLTPGREAMVLSSVEQYAQGRVMPVPAMAQARAKHSATVLADAGLLVAGGFDLKGQAMAHAERWNASTRAWQRVLPMRVARHSHTATLLADGRVMVSGGIGADGQILSSVEVWDPRSQTWSDADPLPIPLYGHAATRLASGAVLTAGGAWIPSDAPMPWAWTWHPDHRSWQVGGHVHTSSTEGLAAHSSHITLVPRADGGALVLTPKHLMRWEPGAAVLQDPTPLWRSRPSAARLPDGRVMWVGELDTQMGSSPLVARVWARPEGASAASTGLWTDAGTLSHRHMSDASTLALPSGQVLHVGMGPRSQMVCEAWQPGTQTWEDCGTLHVQQAVRGRVRLGLLPDQRPFAIFSAEDVFVMDVAQRTWTSWQPTWHTQGLAYGSPIRPEQALLSLRNPATGEVVGIQHEAARHWQDNGSPLMKPSLLWDAKEARWAYVFQGPRMGSDAQWLPDGCALSTRPLAVFQPLTGQVTDLQDPGLGIDPKQVEMVVLPDGTVLAAGVPSGAKDAGAGFYVGQASCAGLQRHAADAGYMAGGLAPEVAMPAAASSTAPSQAKPAWLDRAKALLPSSRTLLITLLVLVLSAFVLSRMSRSGRWVMAALVLVLALVGAGLAWWWQQRQPGAPSATPCRMVGVWTARHGQDVRRVELHDDGRYVMHPKEGGGDRPGGYRGRWSVQGPQMIWQDDSDTSGEPDVNRIVPESDQRFTLVERHGSLTVFEWVRAMPSTRCKP
jgi:Galactose oxidase, central domain